MARDRVGKSGWDAAWARGAPRRGINPLGAGLKNHGARSLEACFSERLGGSGKGRRLLEVGCARSMWLPYFAKHLGFEVHGLDYSELGCQQARAVLAAEGVEAEVTCADLFAPPDSLLGRFDVVTSFGVVEHFDETAACVRALARMLRPGGMVLTQIPNVVGALGLVQRLLDRTIYDMHVPLDREALAAAHRDAGLASVTCEYVLFTSAGILSVDGLPALAAAVKRSLIIKPLNALTLGSWWLESAGVPLPPNRWTSPYVVCTGLKPE